MLVMLILVRYFSISLVSVPDVADNGDKGQDGQDASADLDEETLGGEVVAAIGVSVLIVVTGAHATAGKETYDESVDPEQEQGAHGKLAQVANEVTEVVAVNETEQNVESGLSAVDVETALEEDLEAFLDVDVRVAVGLEARNSELLVTASVKAGVGSVIVTEGEVAEDGSEDEVLDKIALVESFEFHSLVCLVIY